MDLLEYQAKNLFREMGLPVLPAQRIDTLQDLKNLPLAYPIVLKSQVPLGERSRAGGVRFVSNTIDAIAAAQTLFSLPIKGVYPRSLLAEAQYESDREFYLAVVLNRSLGRPVLLGSTRGGVRVREAMADIQHEVVGQEFSAYHARRLAVKMGLQGPLIETISDIVQRMYHLFLQKDLDLVEINPLGVRADGAVMALDGKVTVNDNALGRHPELLALLEQPTSSIAQGWLPDAAIAVNPEGQIGILCNGAGLTMATLDQVQAGDGMVATAINIAGERGVDTSHATLNQRFEEALAYFQAHPVPVLLINLVSGGLSCEAVAIAIQDCLQQLPNPTVTDAQPPMQLVVRLAGEGCDRAQDQLADAHLWLAETLDQAVQQSLRLASGWLDGPLNNGISNGNGGSH